MNFLNHWWFLHVQKGPCWNLTPTAEFLTVFNQNLLNVIKINLLENVWHFLWVCWFLYTLNLKKNHLWISNSKISIGWGLLLIASCSSTKSNDSFIFLCIIWKKWDEIDFKFVWENYLRIEIEAKSHYWHSVQQLDCYISSIVQNFLF